MNTVISEPSNDFVPQFYTMDPETEDLLPSGERLREGMIVLIEDSLVRVNMETETGDGQFASSYTEARALECNRWCKVESLSRDWHDPSIVRFIGVYADGTKRQRTYGSGYAWFVKLDSIPSETPTEPLDHENLNDSLQG